MSAVPAERTQVSAFIDEHQGGPVRPDAFSGATWGIGFDGRPAQFTKTGWQIISRKDRVVSPEVSENGLGSIFREEVSVRFSSRGPTVRHEKATLRRGRARKNGMPNGKIWSRWQNSEVSLFWIAQNGEWLRTTKSSRGWETERAGLDKTEHLRLLGKEGPEPADELDLLAVLSGVDRPEFASIYPLLPASMTPTRSWHPQPPAHLMKALAFTDDLSLVTARLFGTSRVRKDLVKALGRALHANDRLRIATAWAVRDLVPVDWLVAHLNGRGYGSPDQQGLWLSLAQTQNIRAHLTALDARSLRRLLVSGTEHIHDRTLTDIVRYGAAGLTRVDSWTHLHDLTLDIGAGTKPRRAVKIKLDHWQGALEGHAAGGLRLEVAKDSQTLFEWGRLMHNCIGGYSGEMKARSAWLVGVHQGGELVGNIEITSRYAKEGEEAPTLILRQLLGRFNMPLPEATRSDVLSYLASHGVGVPQDYWGSR